ncbi:M24 family metallopeptidase [Bacillus rubiinfantis]|uniref:M24 family metallopeptidase n=1 Tax=Bacillus rubiinfantis TaxID=1499680 RepID=UPI0005A73536|nr:Xaa-Pro peptidase family protein [Bacillus rubiinfantis]
MNKIERLRSKFDQLGIYGMLITNNSNRRYLTGFTGSAGIVILTYSKAILIVDFRYVEQAQSQVRDFEILEVKDSQLLVNEILTVSKDLSLASLGFEQHHVNFHFYNQLKENVGAELVPLSGIVEELRMVKDKDEISKMRTAAEIADDAFLSILNYIHPGVTELEVANELELQMRKRGASSSAFDMIIASGVRSALPHGAPTSKVIETGDMVTLDFGAYYQGYRSDMTRTIAVGQPDEKLCGIYTIVHEALERQVTGIKPGISGRDADALSRDFITQMGFGEKYGHGSGHGVGLDIHESPFMSTRCNDVITEGMVLTVEPGIYIPKLGGVRIEDEILVRENSNEILTKSPKEFISL